MLTTFFSAVLHYEGNRPTHEIYELVTQKFNRKVNMVSPCTLMLLCPLYSFTYALL